jgi:anti-anti-sigma regulatory factor
VSEFGKGIAVGTKGAEVYVRVSGRGTFQNGQPLRRFAQEMIDHGRAQFVIDLAECAGMDSTFLGVLAGIGLRLNQNAGMGSVCIINAGARNTELLQTLGLDRLFDIKAADAGRLEHGATGEVAYQQLPDTNIGGQTGPLSKHDTADLMLEAHDNLIRADQKNLTKFKDLTQFLRENVARRTPTEPQKPSPK